ncbi:MAG TPA: SDR family oxidoreductase [Bryobacteraceae bacterium]|nr:SDR family oxidoreductase [Bryobacteraceae bacterium]
MNHLALITGASSGIGAAFARKLSQRGYDLLLVSRREERLRALAAGLPARCEVFPADLSTDAGISAIERVIQDRPALDLLVNNAGFGSLGRFWETDLRDQIAMHEVHVMATMRLSRAALAGMVPRGQGGVISVSSIAAFIQGPGNVSYCATKAWINSFTEGLDMELRGLGSPVRVQALCPGFTTTEFHETMGVDAKRIPAFLWMKADDVVDASLEGFERGRVIVVPGWKYKIGAVLLKHLPYAIKRRAGRPGGKRV